MLALCAVFVVRSCSRTSQGAHIPDRSDLNTGDVRPHGRASTELWLENQRHALPPPR
jgi:hypothetical protein